MQLQKGPGYFLTVLILALITSTAQASPRAKASAANHFAVLLQSAKASPSLSSVPRTLTTYVNGLGRIAFDFEKAERSSLVPEIRINGIKYHDRSPVVLMKGYGQLGETSLRAAATLHYQAGAPVLHVSFTHTSEHTGEETFYRLKVTDLGQEPNVRIERTKALHFQGGFCGNDHPLAAGTRPGSSNTRHQHPSAPLQNLSSKQIQLSIHADASYMATHGSNTAYIQARLNESEMIYEDNLGLSFEVVRLVADAGLSFGSTEGSDLLVDFADYIEGKGFTDTADVFHVFTAEDIKSSGNSSTIGVAFFGFVNDPDPGVVCRPNRFFNDFGFRPAAVGASERRASSTAGTVMVTFTHEMGHNFAADHSSSGIMEAVLDTSNLPIAFSNESKNQIGTYVGTHGSCLSEASDPEPTPTPTPDENDDSDDSSSGGNSNGGSDPSTPEAVPVQFSHSLTRQGVFTGTISIVEPADSSCEFKIRMSPNKRKIGFGDIVVSAPADGLSHSFQVQATHKARKRNRRGRIKRIWAMGALECTDGDSGVSAVERVKAHRIRIRRKKGARGWIRKLQQAFNAQSSL